MKFGTDGVRELWGRSPFKVDDLIKMARAIAQFIVFKSLPKKVIIGGDTRISTPIVINIFTGVLNSYGISVEKMGVFPTPGLAYLTKKKSFSLGIVISASHNPYYYNGIKLFGSDGFKISSEWEREIEFLFSKENSFEEEEARKLGVEIESREDIKEYQKHLLSLWGKEGKIPLKVVFDGANGATYRLIKDVFSKIVEEPIFINCQPDGFNINEKCGSTYLESLKQEVLSQKADYGIAFDGDGDRVLVVDSQGQLLDGDFLLALFALFLKKKGELSNNLIVATVMSNLGLELFLKQEKIELVRAKVGDKYVLQEMLKKGGILGGEQSGHLILLNHATTGDGILSAIFFLKVLREEGDLISKIRENLKIFPQILVNVSVRPGVKELILEDEDLKIILKSKKKELGEKGRFLLRPSGTEHIFRIMAEGENLEIIKKMVSHLEEYVQSKYGE